MSSQKPCTVRRARPEDAAAILDCLRAAFEPYWALYTPAAFEDTVLTADTLGQRFATMAVFVAVSTSGEVVGTDACHLVGDREGHLRGMAVRPNWQGHGVAEELLAATESELRRAGCGRVTLGTTRPLARAVRFYEAQGFRASGRVSDLFGMELFEYIKNLRTTDMEPTRNDLGQPMGFPLPGWSPPPTPLRAPMEGRYCRLEPPSDTDGRSWTYLAYGPFRDVASYRTWLGETCLADDPLFFAVIDRADGRPAGLVSYLRIAPASGSIEVGHIHYSPRLQRSPAATEAMFLMMRWAFESGYRRYEWKCDALNAASRAAAQRLGLSFEGIFRQATVYKGRNRDTAWYAAIDAEWPALREAFRAWLDPDNFDGNGRQRTRLSDRTRSLLKQCG
jgi:RimJ/RimL family protein N-acetyltransferase